MEKIYKKWALAFICLILSYSSILALTSAEATALQDLRDANPSIGWPAGPADCSWNGVICDGNSNVVQLILNAKGITVIPANIENLTELSILFLDYNAISTLPSTIGNLPKLQYLGLNFNLLTTLPDNIGNLASVNTISATDNLINVLPDQIGNLSSIQQLYLSNNDLLNIPANLSNLNSLIRLYLDNNSISSIPPQLGTIGDNLQRLYLTNNNLSSVPPEISGISKLQRFYLDGNELSTLPGSIVNIGSLQEFLVSNNMLTYEDLEPFVNFPEQYYGYAPQDSVENEEIYNIELGDDLTFDISIGGANNEYQWFKDEVAIDGANSASYSITNAQVFDAGVYTVGVTNTSVNNITIWRRNIYVNSNIQLPVELTRFTGKVSDLFVVLNWETESETNNDFFVLERSKDGIHFEEIGQVDGAGNTTKVSYYSFIDKEPLTGDNYYRLSQMDYDGRQSFSEVIVIEYIGVKTFLIYPNPVVNTINFALDSENQKEVEILVVDPLGKTVINAKRNLIVGRSYLHIDADKLGKGIYFLYVKDHGNTLRTLKFFKE